MASSRENNTVKTEYSYHRRKKCKHATNKQAYKITCTEKKKKSDEADFPQHDVVDSIIDDINKQYNKLGSISQLIFSFVLQLLQLLHHRDYYTTVTTTPP